MLIATTGITIPHPTPALDAILMTTTRPTILGTLQPNSRQNALPVILKMHGVHQLLTMTGSISRFIQENTTDNGMPVLTATQMLQIKLFTVALITTSTTNLIRTTNTI